MSCAFDVEVQGVVRKTLNAIRLCEVNKASKAFIKLSPAEMTMILRHLLPPTVLAKFMDSSKKNFQCVEKPHLPVEQLGRTLRKRRANEDVDFDIITLKRVKCEEEDEREAASPVVDVKEDFEEEDKPEISETIVTKKAVEKEIPAVDVEEVKNEGAKEEDRNELKYFAGKKGWKLREMAELPEMKSINREEEEYREEPVQFEFEGRFQEEHKDFTDDEKLLFEYGFTKMKKDFRAIREQFLPEKSLGDIVAFYYRWKASSKIYEGFKPSCAEKTFAKAENEANENHEGRKKRRSSYLNKDILAKMEQLASAVIVKREIEKKMAKSSKEIILDEKKDKSLKEVKVMKNRLTGKVRGPYKKKALSGPSKKMKKINKE